MTSPPQLLTVECPRCGREYETAYRASINLDLGEEWTDEEIREATTGTCPACGFVVDLGTLVVERGTAKLTRPRWWRFVWRRGDLRRGED